MPLATLPKTEHQHQQLEVYLVLYGSPAAYTGCCCSMG